VYFHITVDVYFEEILISPAEVVPQSVGIADDDFSSRPLVDVLYLEFKRIGLVFHNCRHHEHCQKEEKLDVYGLTDDYNNANHQNTEFVHT
jgi:hypothetical protein